jgi:hypothetical protein
MKLRRGFDRVLTIEDEVNFPFLHSLKREGQEYHQGWIDRL